jgi:hypothetical protein
LISSEISAGFSCMAGSGLQFGRLVETQEKFVRDREASRRITR